MKNFSKKTATPPPEKKEVFKPDFAEKTRAFVSEWAVTIILLLFGTTTLLQAFVVPTGSMEDTVLIGDHMFVDKLAYSPAGPISRFLLPYVEVRRGDIVVFKFPVNPRENYIKRIVGVPGDRIRVVNKQLHLNGKPVEEPYVVHKTPYVDSYRDNFPSEPNTRLAEAAYEMLAHHVVNGEVVVPPGAYFAMGDNRDNSLDSRYWGFVPRENIIGKPSIIFWSYDTSTERLADPNFISIDHLIDLGLNFFTKTRWKRTFMVPKSYPLG